MPGSGKKLEKLLRDAKYLKKKELELRGKDLDALKVLENESLYYVVETHRYPGRKPLTVSEDAAKVLGNQEREYLKRRREGKK